MDTYKSLICPAIVFFLSITMASAQRRNLEDTSQVDSTALALILAAEHSDDIAYIESILKLNPNYTQKGRYGLSALETAYYYKNENTFNLLLEHILSRKDTVFIQKSIILPTAVANGDTAIIRQLLHIYKHKLNSEDVTELFNGYGGFLMTYDSRNKYRAKYEDVYYDLGETKDYDIMLLAFLKRLGVDLNLVDTNERNLMYYCKHYPVVAKYIMENNLVVNFNQKDRFDKTFLDYYIDDLTLHANHPFEQIDEYEKETGVFKKRLDLFDYYVNKGVVLGSRKKNLWKYLLEISIEKKYDYLTYFIKTNYSDRIR